MYTFHFKCQKCREEFNVQFKYMLKKESISCPNCSNTLPQDIFCHVKAAATALFEYGEAETKEDNRFKHFELTIQ